MNESDYDFAGLCRIFKLWYDLQGLSHSRIEERGGPAGPTITKLYAGTWTSTRPRTTADKIDAGVGWPEGTAWGVLSGRPDGPLAEWSTPELRAWADRSAPPVDPQQEPRTVLERLAQLEAQMAELRRLKQLPEDDENTAARSKPA